MLIILVYRKSAGHGDPVKVIKKAVAEALFFYYPLARRLNEEPGRKLAVDCTGEGVMSVEADADVSLAEFDDGDFHPPFPYLEELLLNVPSSSAFAHSPLLLIQVTRLLCGGVIVAIQFNHALMDAAGLLQFINATAEIARGVSQPSVLPVWK